MRLTVKLSLAASQMEVMRGEFLLYGALKNLRGGGVDTQKAYLGIKQIHTAWISKNTLINTTNINTDACSLKQETKKSIKNLTKTTEVCNFTE